MTRIDTPKLIAAAMVLIAGGLIAVPACAEQPVPAGAPFAARATAATPASPAAVKAAPSSPALAREGTSLLMPAPARTDDQAQAGQPALCAAPPGLARLGMTLRHFARRLAAGSPLKIVALGSSSTAGAMASSPAASYPSRLEVDLKRRFPGADITVLNRGVNGEEAEDMLKRMENDVVDEHPDLILWQVGTNAVLRDHSLEAAAQLIHRGIVRLKATGADVVLIDPQYSPQVVAKAEAEPMANLIATVAKRENVALFRRFAVMRHWRVDDRMGFDSFVAPDGLHMNDWGYNCWAKLLGGAIAEATTSGTAVAGARLQGQR